MKQSVRLLRVVRIRCEFHAIPSPNLLASSDPAAKTPIIRIEPIVRGRFTARSDSGHRCIGGRIGGIAAIVRQAAPGH